MSEKSTETKIQEAQTAALEIAQLSDDERSAALESIADAIDARHDEILKANETDVREAEKLLEAGEYSQALVDRLKLSDAKLESITEMVRSVATQEDPLGKTQTARKLDENLELYKSTVPIGVIGTIFESRPDALVQIAALSLKSGNAVILKGGSEASQSNRVLFDIIQDATSDMPNGWSQLIEARADVDTLLEMDDSIDLVMPRGSSEFVSYIQDNTSIPVLGHTEGVCHVYVDDAADLSMATDIAYDAKVQYPAVCNAVETLLVHDTVAEQFLPMIADRYETAGVEMRGDDRVRDIIDTDVATEEDWSTEYGDLVVSIKVVDSMESALDHITTYGSKHTDSIVTDDSERASIFMRSLDSASVFHNASTRFSDGYRFGLGAEVGISTGKTHARGPVGLEGLTTYQYYLEGDGQVVGTYAGSDAKPFLHEDFDGTWNPGSLSE
ncbi:glutamate-5-semialdehyde dehydrogenase [Halorussus salinisoli]|uniref:glutamate-5-semialdehyde dehydrogenase n=1 Tax=Halorussus salinisoli TaxID=2558242 RepID=UPI0010C219B4|nr:glutamate-5-semialdehyde dehydrogenase [Halorussus salinisoli]